MDNRWNQIYANGEQLNRHPYSELVSFFFRSGLGGSQKFTALDVGCGSGVHSYFLAQNGGHVVAFDGSAYATEAAATIFPHENIDFRVATFDQFDAGHAMFDLVFDRCSTSQSAPSVMRDFYAKLKSSLNPGAHIFWQGFCWDNSGREMGREQEDGSWSDFSGGVFEPLGTTSFYTEADIRTCFSGYKILSLRRIGDLDVGSGYDHSTWIVEAEYEA